MEYLKLAKQLISIPSTSDNLKELESVITFCEDYFKDVENLEVKRFYSNGKPSLIISLRKGKSPDIFLNGHLDVVPGRPEQFSPFVKKSKLFGRGAQDMKASCAAMMSLVKNLAKLKKRPSLALMLVTDEEVGGFNGSGFLSKKGYVPKKILIAGESTGLDLEYEAKGVLWLKIASSGKSAHGAYLWEGKNAILEMAKIVGKINKKYPVPKNKLWKTTVNLSKISAGDAVNRVPDRCELTVDIRYIPKENPEKIVSAIQKVVGPSAKLQILVKEPPVQNNLQNRYLGKLMEIVGRVSHKKSKLIKMHGSADTRFFTSLGKPAVSFGPKGGGLHTDKEWVDIKSLEVFYNILKEFAFSLAK